MNYTVDDIAYRQDIEALNKKIDTLAEQSHMNDVSMCSLQETFPTVDEVNDALTKNYVQKNELSSLVDLSSVYTKDEVDDKFNDYTTTTDLNTRLNDYYYNCDEIDQFYLKIDDAKNDFTLKDDLKGYFNKVDNWRMFYHEYTKLPNNEVWKDLAYLDYDATNKKLIFYCETLVNCLLLFTDIDGDKHFIRINKDDVNNKAYLDEVYDKQYNATYDEDACEYVFENIDMKLASTINFNELYHKLDAYNKYEIDDKFREYTKTTGLSNYRAKNDISFDSIKPISFERVDGTSYKTGPFVDGAHIVGTFVKNDKTYILDVNFIKQNISSSTVWVSQELKVSYSVIHWKYNSTKDEYIMTVNSHSGSSVCYPITIESITYEENDELALKSDLINKILALEARIAALENA